MAITEVTKKKREILKKTSTEASCIKTPLPYVCIRLGITGTVYLKKKLKKNKGDRLCYHIFYFHDQRSILSRYINKS